MFLISKSRISLFLMSYAVLFLWAEYPLAAQTIDNTASFRMMDSKKYLRLNIDNDYFTATDDYYTAGINLEFISPGLKKNPLNHLLLTSYYGRKQYGISVEQNGYTPKSIEQETIIYGDRPFAATLMFKSIAISVDSNRHRRLVASLSLGVIGTAAGGYGTQKALHQLIHYTIPLGWDNQIRNDVVINYEFSYEKNLLHIRDKFILNGISTLRAGTLNTKLSSGMVIILGKIDSGIIRAFSESGSGLLPTKKFRFQVYAQPLINFVGYDATLQGGLFNRSSPYTMKADEITRITFQTNYGFILSFGSVYLEYFKSIISKEFQTGDFHRWGGVRVGVKF